MLRILILPLLISAPLLSWPVHAQAIDLVLSADEWCPYKCEPRSDHPGFAVEIARAIFADIGRSADYRVVRWSRRIAQARAGRIDGVISAAPSEAPDLIYPRAPASRAVPYGAALARSFDDGLARLRASGRLAGILARYHVRGCT